MKEKIMDNAKIRIESLVTIMCCTEPEPVIARIGELSAPASCGCGACIDAPLVSIAAAPRVVAGEPAKEVTQDKAELTLQHGIPYIQDGA